MLKKINNLCIVGKYRKWEALLPTYQDEFARTEQLVVTLETESFSALTRKPQHWGVVRLLRLPENWNSRPAVLNSDQAVLRTQSPLSCFLYYVAYKGTIHEQTEQQWLHLIDYYIQSCFFWSRISSSARTWASESGKIWVTHVTWSCKSHISRIRKGCRSKVQRETRAPVFSLSVATELQYGVKSGTIWDSWEAVYFNALWELFDSLSGASRLYIGLQGIQKPLDWWSVYGGSLKPSIHL